MGKRSPQVYAKRREVARMFFRWLLRFYYKHSPECICGWAMKPLKHRIDRYQWKCIWSKCGWETFDSGDGKLHWMKSGHRCVPSVWRKPK